MQPGIKILPVVSSAAAVPIFKAASLGVEYFINWLNSEEGAWCRNMR